MIYPMMMPQPIAGSETPGNGNGAPMMFYAMAPMPMFNPAQNSSSSSVAAPSVSNGVGETPVPLRKPKYNPSRVHHANVAPQEC